MRYIFVQGLALLCTCIVHGSSVGYDELPAGQEANVAKPMDSVPSLLSSVVVTGAESMPPELRYTSPPRHRIVPYEQGSPPDGTRINLDSASSSPVADSRGPPITPPRSYRTMPVALEDTPDRPGLYGEYEVSSDVEAMIDDVPASLRTTRVGYFYSDELLSSLDKQTRVSALMQVSDDIENYKSAPQLSYSFEVVDAQFMPSGKPAILRVTDVITNRFETTIMEIYGMPSKVVKYQANCRALIGSQIQLHPILREYWISKYVERESTKWLQLHNPDVSLQISPRVFFVSPPAALSMRKTSKTDFAMNGLIRSQCVTAGSTVRYMIMERTGSNMEDFMSLHNEATMRIEFGLGMKILYQLITRLKVLHSIGVIHGDIHMGNIVRALGGSRDQFLIIDYGMASFYDLSKPLSEEPSFSIGTFQGSSILSHWEMKGYRRSFRDDILRAMITVGRIMNGPEYIEILQNAEGQADGLENLAKFFERGNFFAMPVAGGYNPLDDVENLTDDTRAIILKKLRDIRKHAQGISGVNMKPDYDYLLREVHHIQTFLE
jgi:hypothetical protein